MPEKQVARGAVGNGMFYVPMNVYGKLRLVEVPVSATADDLVAAQEEDTRRKEVSKRRMYYDALQYASENELCARTELLDPATQRLPEHKRRHAYSTLIQESVDYLADRLGDGWGFEADDPQVQAVIESTMVASDQLSAEEEDGTKTAVTDDALRDALQAGDTPAYVGWDPILQTTYVELWESECVEFRWSRMKKLEMVIRTEIIWVTNDQNLRVQVRERVQYEMSVNPAGVEECVASTFWDDEEGARDVEWLGVGRIPWMLLRAQAKGLRDLRGQSLITEQVMEAADRMNANLQQEFLIGRHNSHGNLVVIGDAAALQLDTGKTLSKDVADVITFPAGTNAYPLLLPTDTQMIRHQVGELKDEILSAFGLVRVDADTWSGLGGVSGYALEILNTKTESTFKRIRRQWRKDWTSLVNLILDVWAWHTAPLVWVDETGAVVTVAENEVPLVPVTPVSTFWEVEPALVFPNRTVRISMGTGYIVDHVQNRDDFVADLISRREALRRDGLSEEQIDVIKEELDGEQPPVPEIGFFGGTGGATGASGTAAGRSLSTTAGG